VNSDGSVIMHSGHDSQHIFGMAIIVSKEKVNTLLEWEPLSDRLIRARFNSKESGEGLFKFAVVLMSTVITT